MDRQGILSKVFMWMFIGLLVTFGTGYFVSLNPNMVLSIFGSWTFLIVIVIELALVVFLAARIAKMSPTTARIAFILYSFVTGLTFSSVFIVYELTSVMYVFLVAALIFGLFAFFGSVTKMDLSRLGTYLLMALLAIIICIIINIFVGSETFDMIISIISILVFIGYTAYDVQKVLRLFDSNVFPEENLAIYGALQLYIDFINIFLELLNLLGNEKN